MSCTDCIAGVQSTIGCLFVAATATRAQIIVHTELRRNPAGELVAYKTRYTAANGTPVTLAAGDTVSLGTCPVT